MGKKKAEPENELGEFVVTVPEPKERELKIQSRSDELKAAAERAVIDSQESYDKGASLAKLIRDCKKAAEGEMKSLLDPFKSAMDSARARFRRYIDPLEEGKETLDKKMLTYMRLEDERRQKEAAAERARAEAEAKKKAEALAEEGRTKEAVKVLEEVIEAPAPAVKAVGPARGLYGGTASGRDNWKFEVVDFSKVPEEYKTVDDAKVNALIRSAKVREIPGLRIYSEKSLSVR